MPDQKNKKRKPHNKYLALTSLSIQMGITIYLGSFVGGYLDEHNTTANNLYTNICVLTSVAISMWMFIKQAKNINN
jgi:hypothetical protein